MKKIKIYRVHSVIRYPEFEQGGNKELPAAKANPRQRHVITTWDIVPAIDVDHALSQVKTKYARENHPIESIFSLNHIGDVTVMEDFGWVETV